MPLSEGFTTVTARCLCNSNTFTTEVPSSSLPLKAWVCHCTSCRHLTGGLHFGGALWPDKALDLSSLKSYSFTPNFNFLACANCGSQMFCQGSSPGLPLVVSTSCLDNNPGIVTYACHQFVWDTVDGGASMWVHPSTSGGRLKRWKDKREQSDELGVAWPYEEAGNKQIHIAKSDTLASPDLTPLRCHCNGVNLFLRSGTRLAELDKPSSSHAVSAKRLEDLGIEPGTGRYITVMDTCDSCRLNVSADISYWASAPISHIVYGGGAQAESLFDTASDLREAIAKSDPRLGTLSRYSSSPGVDRYSCSKCSASFFATNENASSSEVITIAVGVMDHPDGARAEGLLSWDYSRMDFLEDGDGGWREALYHETLGEAKAWRQNLGLG